MKLKALIFDVDGTLSETEDVHRRAFNEMFAAHGLDWDWDETLYRELLKTTGGKERMRAYIRDHLNEDPEPWASRIPALHTDKTRRYVEIVSGGGLELRPGIQALMNSARDAGLRLAVATTTSRPNVEALCRSIWNQGMLEVFDVIAAGDEVKNKKPAPDVFDLALERLGLPAKACIALEDSENGLLSAKAANLPTLIVPGQYTDDGDFSGANLCLTSYEDLTLEQLCNL